VDKADGGECKPCPEGWIGDGVTCEKMNEEKIKVTCLELFCHDACEEDERNGFNRIINSTLKLILEKFYKKKIVLNNHKMAKKISHCKNLCHISLKNSQKAL